MKKDEAISILATSARPREPKMGKLIEEINKMDRLYIDTPSGQIRVLPYDNVIRIIQRIEPEQKTGRWINDQCSNCGYGVNPWNNTPYCPNCGSYNKE